MFTIRCDRFRVAGIVSLAVMLSACASGPKAPQPGTPSFHWLAAKDAYKNGDYVKTDEILSQLTRNSNEYTERARIWQLVLANGLASGYMEMADTFQEGAKKNRANPMPFRRAASDYNTKAAAAAMQYTELAHTYLDTSKSKDAELAFDFPQGSPEPPQQMKKLSGGQMIPEAELALVETDMIRRAVRKVVCRSTDAAGDAEKAKALFQGGAAKAPGAVFVLAIAKGLFDVSDLFGPKKMDQPQRIKIVYQEALDALGLLPDSKDAKALSKKIIDSKKKMNLS